MATPLSIKHVTLAVLLAASINLGWQFHRMHQDAIERAEIAKSGFIICKFGPSQDEMARFLIELSLIVVFVGSCLRGSIGELLITVGLSGATITYVSWWRFYFWVVDNVSDRELEFVQHTAYLIDSSCLDIGIAASIAFLIVLHFTRGPAVYLITLTTEVWFFVMCLRRVGNSSAMRILLFSSSKRAGASPPS